MAEKFTTLADLDNVIQEITKEYRDRVLGAIGDGIQEGAEIFKKSAEQASPADTGEYKNSWMIKPMKKAKFVRYVGNTKRVPGKDKSGKPTMIPLINILEYSTGKKASPHVGKAISNSQDQIIQTIISKIQKESK